MTKRIPITTLIAALAAWFVPPSLPAQSSDSGPALGVARVSLVNGDVTTRRGEAGDWIAAGVNTVVFDRGGYRFHGRVKALADAAREGGLVF